MSKMPPLGVLIVFVVFTLAMPYAGIFEDEVSQYVYAASLFVPLLLVWVFWPIAKMRKVAPPESRGLDILNIVSLFLVMAVIFSSLLIFFFKINAALFQGSAFILILINFVMLSYLMCITFRKPYSVFWNILYFLSIYFLPIGAFFIDSEIKKLSKTNLS